MSLTEKLSQNDGATSRHCHRVDESTIFQALALSCHDLGVRNSTKYVILF